MLKTGPHPADPAAAISRPARISTLRIPAWWRWPAAVVLAWLAFPVQELIPIAGVDPSWQAGLALANEQGLRFGHDVVFTYGPLGFLASPALFVVWSGAAAVAFSLLLQVLLCRTLLHVMRELPALVAVVVTYVVAVVAPANAQAEVGLTIVLALTLSTLLDREAPARWLPVAGGATAAVLILIKPNVGLIALVLTAIAVGTRFPNRLRALGEVGGAFAALFAVLWLATGNAAGDVVPWLKDSAQLVSGYTAGMFINDPNRHHELVQAALLSVVMVALLVRVSAGLPRARRAALALATGIAGFALFKEGFVRHDGHAAIFFAAAAVAAAALARGRMTRFVAAGVAVIAAVWSLAVFQLPASTLLHYSDHVDGAASELRLLADGSERTTTLARTRETMVRGLRLPAGVASDLRAHTLDVQPNETTAVWALGAPWRPEPVFQSYAVLTPALDRVNADFLASPDAAERVLRVNPLSSIDGRNPVYDAPAAFLALVCNYRETYAKGNIEVLAHATNRCGAPRRLSGASVTPGQRVRVPHAGANELVYASITIPRSFSERLRELVWKPATPASIELDGAPFRLTAATATGPLLMRMPASAGIAADALNDAQVEAFRLTGVPSPVQVEFYAVRVGS